MANEGLDTLLKASRALDRPEALAEAINLLWTVWGRKGVEEVASWVAYRAALRLQTMHGRDFVGLCDLRARNSPRASGVSSQPRNGLNAATTNTDKAAALIEAFHRLVPEVRDGKIQLKNIAVENAQATVAFSSVAGVDWFKACGQIKEELRLSVRIVPWSRDAD